MWTWQVPYSVVTKSFGACYGHFLADAPLDFMLDKVYGVYFQRKPHCHFFRVDKRPGKWMARAG
jgi:hypothetical protein